MKLINLSLFVLLTATFAFSFKSNAKVSLKDEYLKELKEAIELEKDKYELSDETLVWFKAIQKEDYHKANKLWADVIMSRDQFLYYSAQSFILSQIGRLNESVEIAHKALINIKNSSDLVSLWDDYFANYLKENALQSGLFPAEQVKQTASLKLKKTYKAQEQLANYLAMFNQDYTTEQIQNMSAKSPIKQILVRKQVLKFLAKNKLNEADEFAQENSPRDYLLRARIAYQKEEYKKSIQFFEKIEKNSPEYIKSREELGWAYLMTGQFGLLSGLVRDLNAQYSEIENRLEGFVLESALSLKNCEYSEVEEKIAQFQKDLSKFVVKVENKELKPKNNFYFEQWTKILKQLKSEEKQNHAKIAGAELDRLTALYNQNMRSLVSEAILKMRFVKLELQTDLKKLEKLALNKEVLIGDVLVASNGEQSLKDQLQLAEAQGKMVFPVTKDIWADEIFKVKGITQSQCANIKKMRAL